MTTATQKEFRTATGIAIATVAAIAVIYWDTLRSMIDIWLRSETFAHGIIVYPAALFLIWRVRDRLAAAAPAPSVLAMVAVVALGAGWLLAHLGDVQVGKQFMFVSMVVAAVWAVLGTEAVKTIAFPLAFTFFAVPFGEVFIPQLMEFTAIFTVAALKLTGIPVYQEGMFLSIPTGDFEIAKACSGIRYLIASFSLGTLYAYLTYHSRWRQILFVLASIIVPIIANGFRAYGIVMLAHLSDMRLAVGVDHIIYGWLFFGIVMFLLFWGGMYFRDEPPEGDATAAPKTRTAPLRSPAVFVGAAAAVAIAAGLPHLARAQLSATASQTVALPDAIPVGVAGWSGPLDVAALWRPAFVGASVESIARYRSEESTVDLLLYGYGTDGELVNSLNRLVTDENNTWIVLSEDRVETGDGNTVREARLYYGNRRLTVWYWYQIGDRQTPSDIKAKLMETAGALRGAPLIRAIVGVAIESGERDTATLRRFYTAHQPSIVDCIRRAHAQCAPLQVPGP